MISPQATVRILGMTCTPLSNRAVRPLNHASGVEALQASWLASASQRRAWCFCSSWPVQAPKSAMLAQVRAHWVELTNHMIRVLTGVLGFSRSLQTLSFRHMRQLVSRLLENASTTVNIIVTLTNLRHHSGHARTPPHRVSPEVTQVSRFKCHPVRTGGRTAALRSH